MILKPFMLRRIKKDVENELSDKVEEWALLNSVYIFKARDTLEFEYTPWKMLDFQHDLVFHLHKHSRKPKIFRYLKWNDPAIIFVWCLLVRKIASMK